MGIEDSIAGIYKAIADCAQISKWAGGIGVHIHDVRGDNALIRSTNGRSTGIMPMLKVFNDVARHVNQSGKRNGSFAMYLEPHHIDIMAFLEAKKNHGDENSRARDLFYAVWLSDLFMERVKNKQMWSLMDPDTCKGLSEVYGNEYKKLYEEYEKDTTKVIKQVPALDVWKEIIKSQMETGTPYICYKDAGNEKSNQKNYGTIKSSNLCVAPETFILTDKGHIEIQKLKDERVNVWNGTEWSEVVVKQTGENQELITISFDDESELTCTPYHKFHIQNGYAKYRRPDGTNCKMTIIEAKDLKENMNIIKCDYPIIDNDSNLVSAYTNGFFTGDGTYSNNMEEHKCEYKALDGKAYCKRHINNQVDDSKSEYCMGISGTKKPRITLYGDKIKLLQYLDYTSHGSILENTNENNKKMNVSLNEINIKEKYFVPINYSLKSKLEWFAGLCDADGSLCKTDDSLTIQVSSVNLDFLKNVKYLLQTCGINPKIGKARSGGKNYLPDGNGSYKEYDTLHVWRIIISTYDLQSLIKSGFSTNRLEIKECNVQREAQRFIKVKSIINNGRKDNTFCFNEPKRHMGIFNGIITGNCTEIYEYSDHKEYACCTLASIALPTYVEEFDYSTINSIDVYTKSDCKFCNYSKGFLKTRGLTYTEHNLDDEIVRGDFFKELNKKSGGIECDGDNCRIVLKNKRFTSVPQIFINGEHIGGFAELYSYFKPTFNYKKLYDVTKVITRNLNKVIDLNFYPVPETRISNFRHRPIGIGVQGLADVYAKYRVSFDSQFASELNKEIFATIYYASCEASYELAQEFATHIQNNMSLSPENRDPMILPEDIEMYNNNDRYLGSYHTFKGSPISQGQFQFDLWKASPLKSVGCVYNDDGSIKSVLNGGVVFNWEELRHKIMEQGMRNSLLLAPMPTASTSQILGNNECIEPFTSNIYSRGTLAGQFVVLNKYLMNDLQAIGVWSNDLMDTIILNNGSINGINAIPEVIRNTYKVVWDLSMKALIDQAADRGIYICQSQSLNLWLEDPDLSKLTSMHFYAWQKGLKTGIYYLRRRAVSKAQTFSIDATKTSVNKNDSSKESDCLMCSS